MQIMRMRHRVQLQVCINKWTLVLMTALPKCTEFCVYLVCVCVVGSEAELRFSLGIEVISRCSDRCNCSIYTIVYISAPPVVSTTTRFIEISTTPSGVITTSPGMVVTTTIGPPITSPGGLTTTPVITLSTIPGTTTKAHVCEDVEGMDNLALIPDSWLSVSSGDPVLLRPRSGERWSSSAQDGAPVLTVDLTEAGTAPDSLVYVESVTLSDIEDVEQFTVTVYTRDITIRNQPVKVEVCVSLPLSVFYHGTQARLEVDCCMFLFVIFNHKRSVFFSVFSRYGSLS